MSWSVSAVGTPAAVKQALEKQFDSAKRNTQSIPHENRSVAMIEAVVNNELDALASAEGKKLIQVEARGSACTEKGTVSTSEVLLNIKPIWGFVG